MRKDKRKAKRRQLRYNAWLAHETTGMQGCMLSDISDTGARLNVEDSTAIPDHFMLWLASNGSARRACSVVWRQPQQIGVRFHGRLVEGDRAAHAAAGDAEGASGS